MYGVPPTPGLAFEIDVVAINKNTYEYGLLRLGLNVSDEEKLEDGYQAERCVKLKIDNLNAVDMFDAHRMRNLKSLFGRHLWPESEPDLHLAYIASAFDLGFRRPLDPTLKNGLVLYLGSNANFSQALYDLDQETKVLRGFPSCPRDFKRTSVERHFRAKGFALDWCEFRLMELREGGTGLYSEIGNNEDELITQIENSTFNSTTQEPNNMTTGLTFPRRDRLPVADLTYLYIQTIVPTLFILMLLFLLLGLIFCLRCPCALEDGDAFDSGLRGGGGEKWDGLTASFFLVLKDCVTCCNSVDEKSKTVSLRSLDNVDHFQQQAAGNNRYLSAKSISSLK